MKNTETAQVIVYIALGSNLDEPVVQIKSARCAIASFGWPARIGFFQSLSKPTYGASESA